MSLLRRGRSAPGPDPVAKADTREPDLPTVARGEIKASDLITRLGGEVDVPPKAREVVAIFGDGRILVAAGYGDSNQVDSAIQSAYLQIPALPRKTPEIVEADEIKAAYRLAAGTSDKQSMEQRLEDLLTEADECGVTDIWMRPAGSAVEMLWRINGDITPPVAFPLATEAGQLNNALYTACDRKSPGGYNEGASQVGRLSPEQNRIRLPKNIASVRVQWSVGGMGRDTSIRLLRSDSIADGERLGLDALDYLPEHRALLELIAEDSDGGIIVGGPVGSGKTTLLKIVLEDYLARRGGSKKAVSLEDPPEFSIRGFSQQLVTAGFDGGRDEDYNRALADLLRQDPNVTMLGEIRDAVTANVFFKIVESGRFSATTLHAPGALAIPRRLRNWEVPDWLLFEPGILRGLIYQRLVPALCHHCSQPLIDALVDQQFMSRQKRDEYQRIAQRLGEARKRWSRADAALGDQDIETVRVRGPGCEHCAPPAPLRRRLELVAKRLSMSEIRFEGNRGVRRQVAVAEVIRPDKGLLDLLQEGPNASRQPLDYWIEELGGKPIEVHLLRRVFAGQVDPIDAHRVRSLEAEVAEQRRTLAAVRVPSAPAGRVRQQPVRAGRLSIVAGSGNNRGGAQ